MVWWWHDDAAADGCPHRHRHHPRAPVPILLGSRQLRSPIPIVVRLEAPDSRGTVLHTANPLHRGAQTAPLEHIQLGDAALPRARGPPLLLLPPWWNISSCCWRVWRLGGKSNKTSREGGTWPGTAPDFPADPTPPDVCPSHLCYRPTKTPRTTPPARPVKQTLEFEKKNVSPTGSPLSSSERPLTTIFSFVHF